MLFYLCLRCYFLSSINKIMSYVQVEFSEKDGGGVAIVSKNWLTPRKREVLWPPLRDQKSFDKYIIKNIEAEEDWKVYSISRCLYETDDYPTAKNKLKLSEKTSDLQTDLEEDSSRKRRRIVPPKLRGSDSDSSEDERPPPLKTYLKNKLKTVDQDGERNTISPRTPQTMNCLSAKNNDLTRISNSISETLNTPTESRKGTPRFETHIDATPNDSVGQNFQEKIVSLLSFIKEQNSQILALLKEKEISNYSMREFPINFPLKTEDDVNSLEDIPREQKDKENLVAFLSNIGGRDHSSRTSRILKYLILDPLATKYSFYGKRSNKKAFVHLRLRDVIVEAVTVKSGCTQKDVEDNIKVWLKHAPDREKTKVKLQEKNRDK